MSREELDEMAYLPGSGPSLDGPADYSYPPYPAQPGFVTAFWNPYEVKHRRRTSRAQLAVLEHEFDADPKPNAEKRRSLASQLNMTPRAIQVWFQNRRAKIKAIKNKIPGGRGMPKLKPGEKAASRAVRLATGPTPDSDDEDDDRPSVCTSSGQWIQHAATPSGSTSPMTASPSGASFPLDPVVSSPPSGDLTPPASTSVSKPQFTIDVPDSTSGPSSAVCSGPPSPDFLAPPAPPPSSEFLAPPSPAAMLRRGSAPAPLQGIHRARYSAFTANSNASANPLRELELGIPPVSPVSPPDHDVAPLRRASLASPARRPSLPDSHLRLPSHPYYSHTYDRSGSGLGPRMQRRGGLLSPVPDVGQEQEQGHVPYHPLSIPTTFPPAPSVHPSQTQNQDPSRVYRALPPGMGTNPAAHDLPTQPPTRPDTFNNGWRAHVPPRPFAVPVAGPLPAADFSFGAPEPGHGDAFNRAMGQEGGDFGHSPNGEYNHPNDFNSSTTDFHATDFSSSPNTEFNPSSATSEFPPSEFPRSDFAPPNATLWDARTRFGSMASIASDVTGVSLSSTQATSVSGGLGTAGFGECAPGEGTLSRFGDVRNGGFDAPNAGFRAGLGYGLGTSCPAGFQPDVRRASCPGEFLHQFSGMGMNGGSSNESGPRSTSMSHMRPSPLGRSLTIAPDAPLSHPNHDQNLNHRGLTLNPESHRAGGVNLALKAKSLRSPTFPLGQVDPTFPPPPPGPNMNDHGPFALREQQQQHSSPEPTGHYQANLAPEQRALVGGGFGSDTGFQPMGGNGGGYETEMRTPPGFDTPPDASSGMEGINSGGMEGMNPGRMGSSGQASPMMFAGVGVEGDPSFDLNVMTPESLAMAMIGQEYAMPGTSEFTFPPQAKSGSEGEDD
ncbi:hypothetical protein FRC06_003477 [Ceratobasidium sp. 370]|nr:hypothetical protein FRC06_003477 [Ceratobasidium sp. 370]